MPPFLFRIASLPGLIALTVLALHGAERPATEEAVPTIARPKTSASGAVNPAKASAADATADWPQWRGPNRDGVAAASPKLLDAWPKEGPKLLWKSAPIPSTFSENGKIADAGGSGSPVVSGGKVFVFVHWKKQVGKLLVTTQMLKDLGWEEGVPDDLAARIEEARLSDRRKDLAGPALDAYIKEFRAGISPDLAKKFDAHIRQRLTQGRNALSWDKDLAHLAKARDREFATYDDLHNAVDHVFKPGTHGAPGTENIFPCFLDPFMAKVFSFTDSVVCLDADSGAEVWKTEFPGDISERELHWGASGTPAICKDRIYVPGSAGFYCLSVKDGAVVWKIKADLGNSSPLVAHGRVYIYAGGVNLADRYSWRAAAALTAFNAENGQVMWQQPQVGHTNGSVAMWTNGGKDYLISAAPGGPWCVDPATGAVLWGCPKGAPGVPGSWTSHTTPVISGDVAVLFAGNLVAYKLAPQQAEMLWKKWENGGRGASPLIFQDNAYFFGGQGHACCVDLKSGEMKWDKQGVTGETSSPVLADGKIFYAPVGGEHLLGLFKASPEKFEMLGTTVAESPLSCPSPYASPAIVGGRLYLRMNDRLACYDVQEHGPYLGGVTVRGDELVFSFKQAGGGLAAKDAAGGTIAGLMVRDVNGRDQPARAAIVGSDIVVNTNGAVPPIEIHSAWSGNLTSKAGSPVPELRWKSPGLRVRQCSGNVLTLSFNTPGDPKVWRSDKAYAVTGAKVTKVELANDALSVRLTLDKPMRIGDPIAIAYPWLATDTIGGPLGRLSFTVLPGRPVTQDLVQEFLFGAGRPKIDAKTILGEETIDRNSKPTAGGDWKFAESFRQTSEGEFGAFNVSEGSGIGGWQNLVHACVYVYSDADRKVQLWAGGGNAIKLIVNGAALPPRPEIGGDPWAADTSKVQDVPLVKGWNTILAAIAQGGGWWSWSLRIRDGQGQVPTGLSYAAEKPEMGK